MSRAAENHRWISNTQIKRNLNARNKEVKAVIPLTLENPPWPVPLKHFSGDLRPACFSLLNKCMFVLAFVLTQDWRVRKTHVVSWSLLEFPKYAKDQYFGVRRKVDLSEKLPWRSSTRRNDPFSSCCVCVLTNAWQTPESFLVSVFQSKQCFVKVTVKRACFWTRCV